MSIALALSLSFSMVAQTPTNPSGLVPKDVVDASRCLQLGQDYVCAFENDFEEWLSRGPRWYIAPSGEMQFPEPGKGAP